MDPAYVESVWWALKQIHDKGLLVEDYRVAPYCPRCGTGLSDHELAQGYETVTDPSRLRPLPADLRPVRRARPSPAGLDDDAVDAGVQHRRRGPPGRRPTSSPPTATETLVVAEPLVDGGARRGLDGAATGSPAPTWSAGPTSGRSSSSSSRPADGGPPPHFVVLADYVTTEDGTGLVHQSPAFGEDDMAVVPAPTALPVVNPVRPDGHFDDDVPLVGGQFFKHADADLVKDLEHARAAVPARRLRAQLPALLALPHAAACTTPSRRGTSAPPQVKDALLRENEKTNWFPETIKWGRYGDWLNNNIDWALSRSRYWGTPLPIWRCDEGHQTCVGSLRRAVRADRHRPVRARPAPPVRRRRRPSPARRCGAATAPRGCPRSSTPGSTRGSMPFAQWGYPHVAGLRRGASSRPTRPTSSARRSTRPAAGSTR